MSEQNFKIYDKKVRHLEKTYIKRELASMCVDLQFENDTLCREIAELRRGEGKAE